MELPASSSCREVLDAASAFIAGELPRADGEHMVSHLTSCESCTTSLSKMIPTLIALRELALREPSEDATQWALGTYRQHYDNAIGKPRREELQLASQVTDTTQPPTDDLQPLETSSETHLEQVCEAFCDNAIRLISTDATKALRLAEAAVNLCESSARSQRSKEIAARCYQVLAGALRSKADLRGARVAMDEAFRLFGEGRQPPELKAKLLLSSYAIQSDIGLREESKKLLDEAGAIFEQLGLVEDCLKVRITLACYKLRAGEVEGAIEILKEARSVSNSSTPPHVLYAILLNLALGYCEVGAVEEAEALWPRLEKVVETVGGDAVIHFLWLQGTISRVRQDWGESLSAFFRVRAHFEEQEQAVHFVESSLDICRVYAAMADWQQLRLVARDTATTVSRFCQEPSILRTIRLLEIGTEERALSGVQMSVLVGLVSGFYGRNVGG